MNKQIEKANIIIVSFCIVLLIIITGVVGYKYIKENEIFNKPQNVINNEIK